MRNIVWILLLITLTVSAQRNERDYLRSGNKLYRDSLYSKAEVDYRKAVELNPRTPQAYFNLGNSLLMQRKADDAIKEYENALRVETNKARQAKIFHNMGVIKQSQKDFGQAISYYKDALRRNPNDDETRYNLQLCQYQLKKQESQQQNQQNQEQKQNEQEKQQEKQQPQDKQDKSQQPQQPKQNEMSKENIEQMLNAAMQDEKKTQEKMKKATARPQRKRLEKQW